VIGLGRIGAPLAACLAAREVEVIGVDSDPDKVDAIAAGTPPVPEPGLGSLLGRAAGSLRATRSVREAVLATDATFITVPTPAEGDGSLSLRHLLPACVAVGRALRFKPEFHLVAVTSTVMPGATAGALTEAIADASGRRPGRDFAACYVPEFVALGTAIRDFLSPDFVLIGEPDPISGELLEGLLRRVCVNDPPVARTSQVAAELAKLAVNAFLATKVTFANVLAELCEGLPGCDVDCVTGIVGLDSRIGGDYLTGATGFGGPCLPRDTAALAALARGLGGKPQLAEATLEINRTLVDRLAGQVRASLPRDGRVGICGLAFKPGTDVVEDSPGAVLARRLANDGIPVIAFDPAVTERSRGVVGAEIELASSLERCVERADVLVLATPAEPFARLDARMVERDGRPRTVIDCWRMLEPAALGDATHLPLGRGRDTQRAAAPATGAIALRRRSGEPAPQDPPVAAG
jgi:UDPglucose 6-dehydrogenase